MRYTAGKRIGGRGLIQDGRSVAGGCVQIRGCTSAMGRARHEGARNSTGNWPVRAGYASTSREVSHGPAGSAQVAGTQEQPGASGARVTCYGASHEPVSHVNHGDARRYDAHARDALANAPQELPDGGCQGAPRAVGGMEARASSVEPGLLPAAVLGSNVECSSGIGVLSGSQH